MNRNSSLRSLQGEGWPDRHGPERSATGDVVTREKSSMIGIQYGKRSVISKRTLSPTICSYLDSFFGKLFPACLLMISVVHSKTLRLSRLD